MSYKLCEVKIEDIFPDEDHINDNNSILDNIIKRDEKDVSILHFYQTPILPQVVYKTKTNNDKVWMITQQNGMSED